MSSCDLYCKNGKRSFDLNCVFFMKRGDMSWLFVILVFLITYSLNNRKTQYTGLKRNKRCCTLCNDNCLGDVDHTLFKYKAFLFTPMLILILLYQIDKSNFMHFCVMFCHSLNNVLGIYSGCSSLYYGFILLFFP